MKSFKLISLQIVTIDNKLVNLELADGLIINKEDDQNTWILEAFLHEDNYQSISKKLPEKDDEVDVLAVITKKDNSPAAFSTHLRTIKSVDGYVSILLEGHLQKSRSKYAELLLEDLINKGIVGQDLINEFKEKIHSRPQLATTKKDISR